MTWPLDPASPPMTAPTPSGGDAAPLSAEDASAFLLRLANDLGTTHGIDDAGVHRRVFNLTPKACDRLREIAAALLAARRGEAELRRQLASLESLIRRNAEDFDRLQVAANGAIKVASEAIAELSSLRAALAATPEEKRDA